MSKQKQNGDSSNWKDLMNMREQVDKHILWRIQAGNIFFRWDNWIGSGSLYQILQLQSKPRYLILDDCITDEGTCDLDFISQLVPTYILYLR